MWNVLTFFKYTLFGSECTCFLYITLLWLLVAQNEKLIEEIELQEFHLKILYWNYKLISIQLRSSRPELLCKKAFITSQNLQENIYAGVSLLIELQACGLCNFILEESPEQVFSCEFCEIFKYTLFNEHIGWLLLSCTFFFKELQMQM